MVRGVLTVVDLAPPGRPRGKKRPGLRLGLNSPLLVASDSSESPMVVRPGVRPSLVVEVALEARGAPDIPALVLTSGSLEGVVLSGGCLGGERVETGALGGDTVDTGMENSPSLTVAVSVTRGIRENSWSGDRELEGRWMTLSSSS